MSDATEMWHIPHVPSKSVEGLYPFSTIYVI